MIFGSLRRGASGTDSFYQEGSTVNVENSPGKALVGSRIGSNETEEILANSRSSPKGIDGEKARHRLSSFNPLKNIAASGIQAPKQVIKEEHDLDESKDLSVVGLDDGLKKDLVPKEAVSSQELDKNTPPKGAAPAIKTSGLTKLKPRHSELSHKNEKPPEEVPVNKEPSNENIEMPVQPSEADDKMENLSCLSLGSQHEIPGLESRLTSTNSSRKAEDPSPGGSQQSLGNDIPDGRN